MNHINHYTCTYNNCGMKPTTTDTQK